MRPFGTPIRSAHLLSEIFRFLKEFVIFVRRYFFTVYDYGGKAGLSEYKKQLGVTPYFPEAIELKFGKKMSCIRCILKLI